MQPFAEVRADLYSGFVNSGNSPGLLLNYRDANNFREVRFSATGVVTINKVVNGVRTMLQTGRYSVPPKTFFHVSVLRDFFRIEVRVNNDPAIVVEGDSDDGVPNQLEGHAGVFASWNQARFDNFAIDELSRLRLQRAGRVEVLAAVARASRFAMICRYFAVQST